MNTPTRVVLRYFGGKAAIATWIVSFFPPHETYVELFGGAASVLMKKSRSKIEIYNDIDDEVYNVFCVLRDHDMSAKLTEQLQLTPYSRAEYDTAFEKCIEPVGRARRTIIRSFQGFGPRSVNIAQKSGFRPATSGGEIKEWVDYPNNVDSFTNRLSGVVLENKVFEDIIGMYDSDTTLFYADPPYIATTRNCKKVYQYEFTELDHKRLSDALKSVKGMAIVSGYASEMYNTLYSGWRVEKTKARSEGVGKEEDKAEREECLWISPNIPEQLKLL